MREKKPIEKPPFWIEKLLRTFCKPAILESILGDLQELYEYRLEQQGRGWAQWYYCWEALGFLRPFALRKRKEESTNSLDMLKSYFLIAIRNLRRQKVVSTINILGFTIGIICCLFIAFYIIDELSYDQLNEKKARIYRMAMDLQRENGTIAETAFSPAPWAPAMQEEFPEIEAFTRFMRYRLEIPIIIEEIQKSFYEADFVWADSAVFEVFSFPLIKGDPKTALAAPNTVVISASTAKRYFGEADPIGKVISYEGRVNLTVMGVMADIPRNSHFQADFLASFSTLPSFWDIIDNWRIHYYYSYFLLKEGSAIGKLSEKMPDFIAKYIDEESQNRYHPVFQPLMDIHLKSNRQDELEANGNIRLLYVFAGIAFLILFVACANYINLATAGSIRRAKEIGIRKVLGSERKKLIGQFLSESCVQILMALILAIGITELCLPYFNHLSGKEIQFLGHESVFLYLSIIVLISMSVGILAALYPAFYLSGLQPIRALKQEIGKTSWKFPFRQGLIVFQFATCTALIIGTLVINDQFNYILKKDTGFSTEQIALLKTDGDVQTVQLLKEEMLTSEMVENASLASHRLIGDQPYYGRYRFDDIPNQEEALSMGRLHVDMDFEATFNIEVLAGRSFQQNHPTDTSAFMINETAIKQLGFASPSEALGKRITYETRGETGPYLRTGPIIGVTKDFHFRSLHHRIQPMVMDIQPARYHFLGVKIKSNQVGKTLEQLEEKWTKVLPNTPFDYAFLNDLFVAQYTAEKNMKALFSLFASIAILIACLGLFGLSSYITAQRTKEIGIRKILGASPSGLLFLLSKDVLKLIMLALILAIPVAWYFLSQWLDNFNYRIELSFGVFLLAAFIAILISFFTVTLQAWKTTVANPIHSLREE